MSKADEIANSADPLLYKASALYTYASELEQRGERASRRLHDLADHLDASEDEDSHMLADDLRSIARGEPSTPQPNTRGAGPTELRDCITRRD